MQLYRIRRSESMSKREHAGSFMLPISVMILMPLLLMWLTKDMAIEWSLPPPLDILIIFCGGMILLFGVILLGVCVRMFSNVGNGTLAPWAATQTLVVEGVYRYMRNPMILGVVLGLFGESIILSNYAILLWCLLFLLGNHIYFIKSEEPGLLKRFGEAYVEYSKNVPRWIPRRSPWTPSRNLYD
jgi:protein-S-isoprenylcysteine O-methyltransferase Ste14